MRVFDIGQQGVEEILFCENGTQACGDLAR